jgi:transcriptional regulator with XRE-family HTH domain
MENGRMDMAGGRGPAFDYISAVISATGLSCRQLADKADLAPSTLTRFLNNPDCKFSPTTTTLLKIAKTTGIPLGPYFGGVNEECIHIDIGRRLLAARAARGFSQAMLATFLGITPQAISGWENGAAAPSISNMVRLAKILAISLDWLLLERGEMMTEEREDTMAWLDVPVRPIVLMARHWGVDMETTPAAFVATHTEAEIRAIPGIGDLWIERIKQGLAKMGLSLAERAGSA